MKCTLKLTELYISGLEKLFNKVLLLYDIVTLTVYGTYNEISRIRYNKLLKYDVIFFYTNNK